MKRVMKTLITLLWITLSLALVLFIIYGIRELKVSIGKDKDTTIREEIHNQTEEAIEEETEDTGEVSEEEIPTEEEEASGTEDTEIQQTPSAGEGDSPDTTIAFTGDVLFPDYLLSVYDKKGIAGLVSEEVKEELAGADITMINQEFPFGTVGEAAPDKQYTFRIPPERVEILKEMGVTMVTLANNHTLDYGREALLETLVTLDNAGISRVGAGKDLEEAKQPVKIETEDMTIGFLGASRVIPVADWNAGVNTPGLLTTYDPKLLLSEIEETKKDCDFVIVYVHWGIERQNKPEEYQRALAKQYIDSGADMVVGSHPHIMQGMEYYQGKPIVYSLGNFIFGKSTKETGILKAEITKEKELKLSLIPCTMEDAVMRVMEKKQGERFFEYLTGISYGAEITLQGEIIEK